MGVLKLLVAVTLITVSTTVILPYSLRLVSSSCMNSQEVSIQLELKNASASSALQLKI